MAPLISAGLGLVTSFFQGRQKVSEAKAQAKIQRLTTGIPGYSDEFLVFIWSAPFVMVFIPGFSQYAKAGFDNLAQLPEWYVAGFMMITGAVFGIDKLLAWKGK